MTEGELEATIKQLVERLDAALEYSAEYRMVVRQLDGMRCTSSPKKSWKIRLLELAAPN